MDRDGITLRDIGIGDAGWIVMRHAELYAADEGFDATFEPLVAQILVDFLRDRNPEADRAWIAWAGERRLGSILCVRVDDATAKLRLFLVEPEARGTGLGKRLLAACIDHARACGFARLVLWTHESHRAACALYAAQGFTLKGARPVRSFGVDLVEQSWELAL